MSRPRLLDLFCGAGGAAMGYYRAGFEVTGVDIAPQPRYPFAFIRGDALEYLLAHGAEYDAIHASPPCQRFSRMLRCRPGMRERHPDLIGVTRAGILLTGRPFAIENVPEAPLISAVMLCGTMFGLQVYRHRCFECSGFFLSPPHGPHRDNCPGMRHRRGGEGISRKGFITVAGHGPNSEYRRRAMGIDWMTRDELAQAIPPAYTAFIGRQLMRQLGGRAAEVRAMVERLGA